jgi:hypothetical protein
MRPRTTLVLGAGSSCGYGFPVGRGLREKILRLDPANESVCIELGVKGKQLRSFIEEFRYSQSDSIDDFLAHRDEFASAGKAAIAKILLHCERGDALFQHDQVDPWYQLLLWTLRAGHSWKDFDPSWLSVVTFNYDRSLEYFLYRSLRSHYGEPKDAIAERLSQLKIFHVYGSLGVPWPGLGHIPYAPEDAQMAQFIPQAAAGLKVIPEGRDNDPSLDPIKQCLREAERICLLGFAFDQTNLRRIGAPQAFLTEQGNVKKLAATCYDLTPAEKERAYKRVTGHDNYPGSFQGCRCSELLRNTLILDPVEQ